MPRILVIDPDATAAQQVAMTFDASGFEQEVCPFDGRSLTERLKAFRPNLLWVRAELGSDALGKILATLERNVEMSQLPIVLLCNDIKDAAYVRQMRVGVVELLQAPFSGRLHVARLRALPQELPERSGTLRGRGTGRDLTALLEHLIRAHRSGSLVVNEGTSSEGRAFFVKGVLKHAWHGGLQGQQSLASICSLPQASWQFSEGADGAGGFIEWDALGDEDDDEPLVGEPIAEPVAPPPQTDPFGLGDSPLPPELDPTFVNPRTEPMKSSRPAPAPQPAPPPPRAPTPPAPAPAPVAPPPSAALEPAPHAAETPILFVDDDPALTRMFATYFSKKGYPVDTAADGVEATQKMLRTRFEVVIADLNMPRLDGWGLLRVIREDMRTHETPVALFSAHDDYRESLRAVHAGAQAYYPKTLRMSALETQVRELLEPRRRFIRLTEQGQSVSQNISALGAQWVMRQLERLRVSGQLDAFDSWATYRFFFSSGSLVHATARAGSQQMDPQQALFAFISGRGIEGTLAFGGAHLESAFGGQTTSALLDWASGTLNDQKKQLRDEAQGQARELEVNGELYQLYATVGPPAWRAIAQLLCETRLLPRDVMARLNVSPGEVAAVVNDLLLRGVVSFKT